MVKSRLDGVCRLLFVGSEWTRKGGDFAINIAEAIRRSGRTISLVLVGPRPASNLRLPSYAHCLSGLPLGDKDNGIQFDRLYSGATFLLLPSRADCTPVVICEAFSYGVPVVATPVGGIPEMVEHGRTGFLSPLNSREDIEEIASLMGHTLDLPNLYCEMAQECITEALRFDWVVHTKRILDVMRLQLLGKR